jgi:hypothetical protein
MVEPAPSSNFGPNKGSFTAHISVVEMTEDRPGCSGNGGELSLTSSALFIGAWDSMAHAAFFVPETARPAEIHTRDMDTETWCLIQMAG